MRGEVSVAMLGARMHYAVPVILQEAGLLHRFFTDSYAGNKPWLSSLLRHAPLGPLRDEATRWLGRSEPRLPAQRVVSFEGLGIGYSLARRKVRDPAGLERIHAEAGRRFADAILRRGLGSASVVWGYNTASRELFDVARAEGRRCIVEQTILPYRLISGLLQREAEDWPGWQPVEHLARADHLDARETAEWTLSDRIVAGSAFVAEGLIRCGTPPEKIRVIPYGVDLARFAGRPPSPAPETDPLRIAFIGEAGLRKGAPYLLEALGHLGSRRVKCRFAGHIALSPERLSAFKDVAEFLGPVPRLEIHKLFDWAQVLVLPSIVEGSATATYEALLSGLPVITTPNAGSIVRDGVDGRIVPIRDAMAIAEALRAYIDDPDFRASHAAQARLSRQRASLDRYGRDLVNLIREVIPS